MHPERLASFALGHTPHVEPSREDKRHLLETRLVEPGLSYEQAVHLGDDLPLLRRTRLGIAATNTLIPAPAAHL